MRIRLNFIKTMVIDFVKMFLSSKELLADIMLQSNRICDSKRKFAARRTDIKQGDCSQ